MIDEVNESKEKRGEHTVELIFGFVFKKVVDQ